MPTYIYSKSDFIEFIETQVGNDEVIVFTNELSGQMSISSKSGIKVTHQYSEKAFKDVGVGHIAFGETQALGVLIAKKNRLSKDGTTAMKNIKTSEKDHKP